ncbi:MAG: mechanosensitive ion channel [Verrucomicrobiota bacterium]|nr:mechanosensitive ion channel [Verrucomicrobiota bacterium]
MNIWNQFLDWIKTIELGTPMQLHMALSVGVVVCALLVLRLLSKISDRRIKNPAKRYSARKTYTYIVVALSAIFLLQIWIEGKTGIAAYLGIVSAGLAIALKDPLTNLAAWLFIAGRKPFIVGDRIQIGEHAGDVIDLRPFAFSLLEIGNWVDADQSTGRIIHLPNGLVFTQAVANYAQGFNFIWNEIPVMITFESNWEAAKKRLASIGEHHSAIHGEQAEKEVRKAARKFLIYFRHLTPIVWTSVADSGVVLTIRYLCDPRKRRSSETLIWEDILKAFATSPDIDLAYPTQRFYDNAREGKPGTGGPQNMNVAP